MNKGKFIVVEGIEGAGKSSAICVIEAVLNKHDIPFIKTREPGGTPLAEALRDIVKSASHDEELTQETELLLMYAGTWVIGDRHDLSSRAYQGGGRQFDDRIMNAIADVTLKGFTPDLTLYLDITPELGLARAQARGELDRIELEKIEFFQRVRNKYLELATASETTDIIDASQDMLSVHNDVAKVIEAFIERKAG